jgi:hypothetical protein
MRFIVEPLLIPTGGSRQQEKNRPVRGGVMLYLPEEAPAGRTSSKDVLKKMGL